MHRDDTAVTQVYALIIALALFMGAIAAVLLWSGGFGADSDENQDAEGRVRSDNLADFLVGSPGIGWEAGADGVARIGFANASGPGLDDDHLDLLRGGRFGADPTNGLVDYLEAMESLGLDNDTTGFHIRMAPVALHEVLVSVDLSHLRAAYISDWVSLPAVLTVNDVADPEEQIRIANDDLNLTAGDLSDEERSAIRSLGFTYNDRIFVGPEGPDVFVGLLLTPLLVDVGMAEIDGDVYPDDKGYLDDVLPDRLDLYDVLIVGSEVDQNSLTSNVMKDAINDWVLAGGTLIVLGSDSQNIQWIQPLFSLGTSTVNGGAYANDPSHPALWEPNALDWTSYDNHGLGWDIKDTGSGGDYDKFIHVIQEDGDDVLAISREGAFGDGRIYLTTFRAGEIAQEQGLAEALGFVENMILYHDRSHLFLEYGPEVPQDAAIHVAIRQSFIWDYDLGQVPVRLEILSWEN